MDSLYGRLFRYRTRETRAPLEDFLSEALVDLLGRIPARLVVEFVARALEKDDSTQKHWRRYASGKTRFRWSTQNYVWEPACGYVDILLEVDGRPILVIENKIGSGIRTHAEPDSNQLSTYGQWLSTRTVEAWRGGLVLLTHATEPPDDFVSGNPKYGAVYTSILSWTTVAKWLKGIIADNHLEADGTWITLARELLAFLKEQNMADSTITHSDLAALQMFLPASQRFSDTFQRVWSATLDLRRELCASKTPNLYYDEDGIAWGWAYTHTPAPLKSYIGFGIRFPEQSDWWPDAVLPQHPHAFVTIGSDNNSLEWESARALPAGWVQAECDLITAKPLHDFRAQPDEFSEDLITWASARMREAVELLKTVGSKERRRRTRA